jgi:broad-specificity NMP kinase
MSSRLLPNILICGTPGCGKSSLCEALVEMPRLSSLGLKHIVFGTLAKEKNFHAGRDERLDTLLIDEASEDLLLDELEPIAAAGGLVLEHHSCSFFPERWFDLVLVLRTNNTELYDRLKQRGYTENKIRENVECEIMQVVADEAIESFPREGVVQQLVSERLYDLESNTSRIESWIFSWISDQQSQQKRKQG